MYVELVFVLRVTFEARLGKPTAAARVILPSIYTLHIAKTTTILFIQR